MTDTHRPSTCWDRQHEGARDDRAWKAAKSWLTEAESSSTDSPEYAETSGVPVGSLREKECAMKARILDTCTACGLCCDTCPEVFEMGDDMATVIVDTVPTPCEDAAQQAADECPVQAIVIERP